MADDRRWLLRALRLASLALGTTAPNPGVGCVLVRDQRILGEGHTGPARFQPQIHAEAAAIAQARAAGHDLRGATAYVTLAPCTARSAGGTSCTDLLLQAGIICVVVAVDDPQQPQTAERFAAAGIAYEANRLPDLARRVHGGFLCRVTAKRPRFTGKWAMTLDGCLAAHTGKSSWISSPQALALSRRRRRAFDAILIGGGTALTDDPQLLATRPRSIAPRRIVVSAAAALDEDSRLLHSLDQAPLLVVHRLGAETARLAAWGAELQALEDPHDLPALARTLGGWGLNDVLVEGGATMHGAFLRAGLYDRLELYQGAVTIGGGLPVARGHGAPTIPDGQTWHLEEPPRMLASTVLTRWSRS